MKKIACLLLAAAPLLSSAADSWLPVKDVNLMIDKGSILDFSSLFPAVTINDYLVVNPAGQLALSKTPGTPQRFLMGSLGFGTATGGIPDHAATDQYVTQLQRHGYNMARLDFQDATLMYNRIKDLDFDPEGVDRIQYLLAALKKAGIYYVLNGLSSDNAAFGDIPERWVNYRSAKLRVYYDPVMQDHWRQMMTKMFATVNPYTKMTTYADPAFAGLILVNEGSLPFLNNFAAPDALRPTYNTWLKQKYGTTAALAKAWGAKLLSGETVEAASVAFVRNDDGTSPRMSDQQAFFVSLETTTATWMTNYVRAAGYKGLITSYNNWLSPAEQYTRNQFNWVDMHNYFAEPDGFSYPGSTMRQDSLLTGGAQYIGELAVSRQYGKAFTVSEFGQVFWNKYRRESGLAFPAYAAFQDWGMIAQHAYAVVLNYSTDPGTRQEAIYPFVVGTDPIARASETLAALLYRRGDVAKANHRVGVSYDSSYVYDNSSSWGAMPGDIRRLALVTGVGLDWQGKLEKTTINGKLVYDATIQPGNNTVRVAGVTAPAFASKLLSNTGVWADDQFNDRMTGLRQANVLAADPRNNTVAGLYLSDTGQIGLDGQRKRLTVITPLTEGVVFATPEAVTLNYVRLEQANGPALVAVASVDGAVLNQSKRMLVVLSSDARNTGMTFSDAEETTLKTFGTKPVTILNRAVTIHLTNVNAKLLKVYSNTLSGQRADTIPVIQEANGISFTIDNSKLSHGPTTYFEVVTQ